jgi:hypothetical protein
MTADLELQDWREQWKSETPIPPSLQRSVERHSLFMKVGLACDVVVTLVIGGGATLWAWRAPGREMIPVAIASWLFLLVAWVFVLLTNRGLWSPSSLDASSFVDLSIRRCRSVLSTIWFAWGLFFAEIIFGMVWAYLHLAKPHSALLPWLLFSSLRVDIVWAVTIAFVMGSVWYRGRKQVELTRLLELRTEIIDATERNPSLDSEGKESWLFAASKRRKRRRKLDA